MENGPDDYGAALALAIQFSYENGRVTQFHFLIRDYPGQLGSFAILALICHGELYRRRPAARDLTEFYLCISLGGAIGGACAGLAAPYVFNDIYEYPILIACDQSAQIEVGVGGEPRRDQHDRANHDARDDYYLPHVVYRRSVIAVRLNRSACRRSSVGRP